MTDVQIYCLVRYGFVPPIPKLLGPIVASVLLVTAACVAVMLMGDGR